MSAPAQIDTGTQIITGDLENEASIEERLTIRDSIPLPILLNSVAKFLREVKSEAAVFIQSLPEVDPETLDPNNRNCTICWDDFKLLQSKDNSSSPTERDSTPLQLPCAHNICKTCIQDWLAKTGTCPWCRHQCTRREFIGNDAAFKRDRRRRESYQAFAEIAQNYLATINPRNNTYGEFSDWAFIGETDFLKLRAQWAVNDFNQFSTAFEEQMLQGPDGRRLLTKLRAALAAGTAMMEESDSSEDEEWSNDVGNSFTEEDDFEGLAYAEAVLEEYGSTDEEEESTDDDDDDNDDDDDEFCEYIVESENAIAAVTATAAMEEEEEEGKDENLVVMDVREDHDDDVVDPDDTEIEENQQHPSVSLLGCAALISVAGIGVLMTSRVCTCTTNN